VSGQKALAEAVTAATGRALVADRINAVTNTFIRSDQHYILARLANPQGSLLITRQVGPVATPPVLVTGLLTGPQRNRIA